MATPIPVVLTLARETLHLNQLGLAELLGSSLRTVQRWEARRGQPSIAEMQVLADAVRPHDPDLASQIDVWAPRPAPPAPPVLLPAAVEIAAPPVLPLPLPPPPPVPPVPQAVLVDSVVCAAAEAMALSPQAVRPAVLAAFARAREAGLTLEAVVGALAPPPPPPAAEEKPAKAKGSRAPTPG